jgi:hypothetical protein
LIEIVDGNNPGTGVRVITDPSGDAFFVFAGTGPLGPQADVPLYNWAGLRPDVGCRIKVARPSVGSVRCYFLEPTSVEFSYAETLFSIELAGQTQSYRPDPENLRTILPAPPTTTLPGDGETSTVLTDASKNFLSLGIKPGDLLDVLYIPIVGDNPLADPADVIVGGLTLILRLDNDPFIQVSFPYNMPRADVVEYINDQVGLDVAYLETGTLVLKASRRIEISLESSALAALELTTYTTDHPAKGTYVIGEVATDILTPSVLTPLPGIPSESSTYYKIRRYLQRVSSTEMNLNTDATGLYYADVEAVSLLPGDLYNIGEDLEMATTGHRGDGYRLSCDDSTLSYSRAEALRAQVSRSILLVGAADSLEEHVQLNLQNVQVSYERSALVDEVQSFCSSRFRRVVCEDILVRHLLPHYVSLNWSYAGGPTEPDALRALTTYLDSIAGGEELEVGMLVEVLRKKQALSVFTPDTTNALGRQAPIILVISHGVDRKIRGSLVRDVVDTVRTQRYLPDQILVKRLSSSGLR